MPYAKDSVVIVIRAGEDGYFTNYYKWDESPVPVRRLESELVASGPAWHQDRISEDKTNLKSEMQQFIDNIFDT